ncbi:SDR family NAD(P)-dependent oxidoreductase [Craterilacuibacter sinensis]|uniref:SDR family NAD(P)-dependent oxidoreductase n=1 Tax=Craterilacuibacter sinensis TaxID=2686017 RepID=UPI001C824B71|nr:SDR family NAD(P)-dependent oxidoreductase [Craterilacuibacter sinensis]
MAENYKPVDIKPIDPAYFIPKRHEGRTYFITGGARGIGAASAIRLAREGANVVIFDVLDKDGKETVAQIRKEGGKAEFVKGDVRSNEDLQKAVDLTLRTYGEINGALNSAGIMAAMAPDAVFDYQKQKNLLPSAIADAGDEYFDTLMDVNATGVFKSMRAELKPMLKQGKGGAIVNICSIAGLTGLAGNSAYVASKHACNGLTRNGAIDYAPYGIRVNSVNMAATETAMTDMAIKYVMAASKDNPNTEVPNMGRTKTLSLLAYADSKKRQSTVWEQAAVICFLLSDEASNLTGAIYATDGGWTAY